MEENIPTPQVANSGGATEVKPSHIVVKLDRHEAIHTDASTRWYVKAGILTYSMDEAMEKGLVKPVYTTRSAYKTHWDEYLEVLTPNITLVRVRVSNRGNVSTSEYPPETLKAPEEEVESIMLAGRAEE
jgi:hypothetical protein